VTLQGDSVLNLLKLKGKLGPISYLSGVSSV